MFAQERKQLEFGRNSGWYRHWKEKRLEGRKGATLTCCGDSKRIQPLLQKKQVQKPISSVCP